MKENLIIKIVSMGRGKKEVRNKMVVVRMNETEYGILEKFNKESTCRSVSQYLRKVALNQPVTVKYRNQSADEFLSDMLKLKKDLNGVANNFNQAVHKLHMLERIPEFRTWVILYEGTKQAVEKKIDEIKVRMDQIYKQWLQR